MKIMSAVAATVVVASIALSGCGLESSTTPDTAPPQAPQITAAYAKGSDKAVIRWTAGSESDLAGYNVYLLSPLTRVNAALVTAPEFVDTNLPVGDVFYRVTAVDRTGNESAPSNVAKVVAGARTVVDVHGEGAQK